jgi:hypothetical protein
VIADLVAGGGDLARDHGEALDVGPAKEEGGGCPVLSQDIEDLGRGLRWSVVESESNGVPRGGASPDIRGEHGGRSFESFPETDLPDR